MSSAEGISKSHTAPHSMVRFEEQVMSGGVVSTTVFVWLQVALLLQASVACQMRMAWNVCPHRAFVIVWRTVTTTPVPEQTS
jgi:hypothetical protein